MITFRFISSNQSFTKQSSLTALRPATFATSILAMAMFAITSNAHANNTTNTPSPYIQLYQNKLGTQSTVNEAAINQTRNENNTLNNGSNITAYNDNPVPPARISTTRTVLPVTKITPPPEYLQSQAQAQAAASSAYTAPPASIRQPLAQQAAQPIPSYSPRPTTQSQNVQGGQLTNIPMPIATVNSVSYIPTMFIAQTQNGNSGQIDVSLLDDFIAELSPHARHYPPRFKTASDRYYSKQKLKEFESWIRPYAEANNASYDVLLRAAKLNGMARNLDLDTEYALRANDYVTKAIALQPNSQEANFLYGMLISEGGGFKEGAKYLEKAASLGYIEAEQSLAQSALLDDRREEALSRLRRLQSQNPNNRVIAQQIQLIENGKYYIWDLPFTNN